MALGALVVPAGGILITAQPPLLHLYVELAQSDLLHLAVPYLQCLVRLLPAPLRDHPQPPSVNQAVRVCRQECKLCNLMSVDVSPCPKQPCRLARGSSYTINVTFTSSEDTGRLTAVVQGLLFNVPLPVFIPEHNGCKSGISCPVKEGKTYSYITTLPILYIYPKVMLVLHWQLLDAGSQDFLCWEIPVKIMDG
uniref:NPC intracellular cholesterol transporter 2 n=1 Tax=Leptobrachium leishanense TaxID=445787 RepID=A0A8C5Q0N4_9ANUR